MKSFSFWFFIAPFYHILSGYFRISVLVFSFDGILRNVEAIQQVA